MLTEGGKDNLLTQKKRNNELNGIAYWAMNNTEGKDSTMDYNGDYWKDLKG